MPESQPKPFTHIPNITHKEACYRVEHILSILHTHVFRLELLLFGLIVLFLLCEGSFCDELMHVNESEWRKENQGTSSQESDLVC